MEAFTCNRAGTGTRELKGAEIVLELNKGVNAEMSLLIPKSMMKQIGITKMWEGVTIRVVKGSIIIERAKCPKCNGMMIEMKRGGIACRECGACKERM